MPHMAGDVAGSVLVRRSARKYLRLLGVFASYQFIRDLQFRSSFLIRAVGNLGEFGFMIVFFSAISANDLAVPGWTLQQTLFLLGTYQMVNALYLMFFSGIGHLSWMVERGDLDVLLTKPVDSQFVVSFQRINYDAVFGLMLAAVVIVSSWKEMGVPTPGWRWVPYAILVAVGALLKYAVGFLIMTLSLWVTRIEALYFLFLDFFVIGQYPADIFHGAARIVFTLLIPVVVVANVPASVILHGCTWTGAATAIGVTAAFLVAGRALWKASLKRYSSASS